MNPRQKVIFTQLQIASVGVLLLVFGLMWSEVWLIVFGVIVMVYGLIRAWLFGRIVSKEDENEEPMDLSLDWDQNKEDDEGEYPMDEWEELFTRRLGGRAFTSARFFEDELAKLEAKKAADACSQKDGHPPKTASALAGPKEKNIDDGICSSSDPDGNSIPFPADPNLPNPHPDSKDAHQNCDSNQQNQ